MPKTGKKKKSNTKYFIEFSYSYIITGLLVIYFKYKNKDNKI